jgi:hypothetical protein
MQTSLGKQKSIQLIECFLKKLYLSIGLLHAESPTIPRFINTYNLQKHHNKLLFILFITILI